MTKDGKEETPKEAEGLDNIVDKLQEKIQGLLGDQYGVKVMMPTMAPTQTKESDPEDEEAPKIKFDMLPLQLESRLREFVVGQPEATRSLSTKVCTHFHRVAWESTTDEEFHLVGEVKANMLIIGPTGVGKTYIIRLIAEELGVPLVKGDATKFTETGYVGGDVEQLVRDLVHHADGHIELAEHGIIYLDEIDKIASSGSTHGPDVSRTGVQRNLLKLMEEAEVDLRAPFDLASQMEAMIEAQRTGKVQRRKINTKNILFVMSGAFVGLEEIIKRRLRKKLIGFESEVDESPDDIYKLLSQVRSEDLIEYGFEPEFVGRLPILVVLRPLEEDELFEILRNPKSPLTQGKIRDFASYGIELKLEDEALREIAHRAITEGTGARGLKSILERVLLPLEHSLPGSGVSSVIVTKNTIMDTDSFLSTLLFDGSLIQFVTEFRTRTGVRLTFSEAAREWIREKAREEGMTALRFCEGLFSDYEYGLKLVKKSTIRIGIRTCRNPRKFLDGLIKQAYAEATIEVNDTQADAYGSGEEEP